MSKVDILENPYQCAVCEQRFSEKSAREKHYFTHANMSYGVKACRNCGRYCINSEHCRPKNKSTCKKCRFSVTLDTDAKHNNKAMSEKNAVELRVKPKHICDICDKPFTSKRGLQLHLAIHFNIKPYICHVCDKAFRWKTILHDHLLTHSNVKAFGCEFCNRHFRTKKGLKKHYLIHTQEKPYMCEICARCFSAKGNLKTHYRTHNKIKKE